MSFLTREDILALDDITVKEITVPDSIPVWGGRKLMIKQLSRGQQDAYLLRQFGETKLRQDRKTTNQEITLPTIYGHDAWLCVRGICDEYGRLLFTDKDIPALEDKSGEAIGWIAREIVVFSGMAQDQKVASGEKTPEQALEEEVKN